MQSPTGQNPTPATVFKSPVLIKPFANQLRAELSPISSPNQSESSFKVPGTGKYMFALDTFYSGFTNIPFSEIIPPKLDINEISLQLLDEIDPTFWSLQSFLKAVGTFSGPYYQELSFNQLVKSYTASLCLRSLRKDDHYYDKASFFDSPIKISNELRSCQNQIESNGRASISEDKMFYVISTLKKLGDLLNQIKNAPASEKFTLYQSIIWPNESCIATLVHYFPIFNDLLPLKKTDTKAELCLIKLKEELESITNPKTVNQLVLGLQSFEEYVESVFKEVNQWYSGSLVLPTTPRKRSFDLVDARFNEDFPAQGNLADPFNSSPIVRVKSQIRKRRRYSVA